MTARSSGKGLELMSVDVLFVMTSVTTIGSREENSRQMQLIRIVLSKRVANHSSHLTNDSCGDYFSRKVNLLNEGQTTHSHRTLIRQKHASNGWQTLLATQSTGIFVVQLTVKCMQQHDRIFCSLCSEVTCCAP